MNPSRIINYLTSNATDILCIFLAALALNSFLPLYLKIGSLIDDILNSSNAYLSNIPTLYFLGVAALLALLGVLLSGRLSSLFARYKATYISQKPAFTIWGFVVWFMGFFIFLFWLREVLRLRYYVLVNLIIGVICLSNVYLERRNTNREKKPAFPISTLSDYPIDTDEQDFLGRSSFVEALYNEITNIPFTDSFVFGLYGAWGEGKTSVLHLLKRRFVNNTGYLLVDFDPWYFKDEKAILPAFYEAVERIINQAFVFPGLKRAFVKYQKMLSPELSPFGLKLNLNLGDETLDQVKERIEQYILRTKKKILIIIDDIDRLQPNEILLVFKLVRLNAKFKNTIFILSFDELKVAKAISQDESGNREYIEKIIQQPIHLPAIEKRDVENYIDKQLDALLDSLSLTEPERAKFNDQFSFV